MITNTWLKIESDFWGIFPLWNQFCTKDSLLFMGSIMRNTSILTSVDDMAVLIIEDSEATAGVMSDYLKKLNYKEIHICHDGTTGINKFLELSSSSRSPLVFLDYYLPDMEAVTVFKELIEVQPKAKIILETVGGKYDDGINYLLQQGAYHFLQKPFSFDDLKRMMSKFETEQVLFAQS